MFEAYKIGVSIGVIDATRGSILKIAAQFAKAQTEASSFLETLRRVNEELARPSSWAGTAANDFRTARQEAEGYSRAARSARAGGVVGGSIIAAGAAYAGGASAGRGLVSLGAVAGGNRALSLQNQAAVPLLNGPASGGGGPPLTVAGGAGGGGLSPQAQNMFGAGGPWWRAGWGGGGGAGGGGATGGTGGGLGGVMGGLIIEHAGKAELGMLEGPIEEAARYQTAIAKFKLFGLTDQLNSDAISFAKSMNIIGLSLTDGMKFMTEAQGVFRESGLEGAQALAGAKLAAPMLAKISFATSGLDEESRGRAEAQSLDMLRFIEMRGGLQSATKFNAIADAGWKAIQTSGGNVKWPELRQFMATAGVSGQNLSNEALFGKLEPIIGEMKGKAGVALMTAYNRLAGAIRLPNQVAHEFSDNGIWDPKKIVWNSQGGIKRFNGNPLGDEKMNLLSTDPTAFYDNYIMPMYEKHNYSQIERARQNAINFGRTGGAFFTLYDRQRKVSHDSVESQKKALGVGASVDLVSGTFQGQMLDYHAKVNNLQIQLGTVILPMLIKGLMWLNPRLQAMADWVGEHSTLTKGLLVLFAGLASLTVVSGAIVTISGAFTLIRGALAGSAIASGLGGIAARLSILSPMLSAFGLALRPIAIGVAAYKAGTWVYDHALAGTDASDWIGRQEARVLALFGNKDAKDALDSESRYIAKQKAGPQMTHVTLNLDGRRFAEAMAKHQGDAFSAPQTGISGFDSSLIQMPAGALGGF